MNTWQFIEKVIKLNLIHCQVSEVYCDAVLSRYPVGSHYVGPEVYAAVYRALRRNPWVVFGLSKEEYKTLTENSDNRMSTALRVSACILNSLTAVAKVRFRRHQRAIAQRDAEVLAQYIQENLLDVVKGARAEGCMVVIEFPATEARSAEPITGFSEEETKIIIPRHLVKVDLRDNRVHRAIVTEDGVAVDAYFGDSPHPHAGVDGVCLGSAGPALTQAIEDRDIESFVYGWAMFLRFYNPMDDAGTHFHKWPFVDEEAGERIREEMEGTRCTLCEVHCMEDDMSYTDDYGGGLCPDCFQERYVWCEYYQADFLTDSVVWSGYHDSYILEEDAMYLEDYQDYFHEDVLYYSEFLDTYIPYDHLFAICRDKEWYIHERDAVELYDTWLLEEIGNEYHEYTHWHEDYLVTIDLQDDMLWPLVNAIEEEGFESFEDYTFQVPYFPDERVPDEESLKRDILATLENFYLACAGKEFSEEDEEEVEEAA